VQNSKEVMQRDHTAVARQSYVAKAVSNLVRNPNIGEVQQDQEMEPRSFDASIVEAETDEHGRSVTSNGGSDAGGALLVTKKKGGPT
jgi:hypothetical protein